MGITMFISSNRLAFPTAEKLVKNVALYYYNILLNLQK